jgi:hypothetical protein
MRLDILFIQAKKKGRFASTEAQDVRAARITAS